MTCDGAPSGHRARGLSAAVMAAATHNDNRLLAIACILAGVGLASTQDAIVKSISGGYPVYEALMSDLKSSTKLFMPSRAFALQNLAG